VSEWMRKELQQQPVAHSPPPPTPPNRPLRFLLTSSPPPLRWRLSSLPPSLLMGLLCEKRRGGVIVSRRTSLLGVGQILESRPVSHSVRHGVRLAVILSEIDKGTSARLPHWVVGLGWVRLARESARSAPETSAPSRLRDQGYGDHHRGASFEKGIQSCASTGPRRGTF
jgi:hypothetical protein